MRYSETLRIFEWQNFTYAIPPLQPPSRTFFVKKGGARAKCPKSFMSGIATLMKVQPWR